VKPHATRIAVATALLLASVPGAGVAVAAPARTSREAVSALRTQVDAGQVKAATVYNRAHVIHASLAGGRRYSVHYTAAQRRTLVSALLAHHVRFHIVTGATKAHGLRRRYVVLIVVAALAALAAAGFGFARRRRRGRPALD
jgi:hypothetical protein